MDELAPKNDDTSRLTRARASFAYALDAAKPRPGQAFLFHGSEEAVLAGISSKLDTFLAVQTAKLAYDEERDRVAAVRSERNERAIRWATIAIAFATAWTALHDAWPLLRGLLF